MTLYSALTFIIAVLPGDVGATFSLPDIPDAHFIFRHAQCRLCTEMGNIWCPTAPVLRGGNRTDSDGICVDPQRNLCPNSGLTDSEQCPGDEPATKASCTLCTLDSFTWCPDLAGAPMEINEYEGRCVASGPCGQQVTKPRTDLEHDDDNHWHHHDHGYRHHHHHERFLENGIKDVGFCKLDDTSGIAMAVGAASVGLWLGTFAMCLLCLAGSVVAVCTCKVLTSKATRRCCSDIVKSLRNRSRISSTTTPVTQDEHLDNTINTEDELVEHETVVGIAQTSPHIRAVNDPRPILRSQPTNNFGSSGSSQKNMFYPDMKAEYKLIPLATATTSE
eukprot:jgi/Bigna1/129856/aug1.10_g4564